MKARGRLWVMRPQQSLGWGYKFAFLCVRVCDDVVVVYRSVIDSKSGAIYFDGFFSGGWGINGTQNE